MKLWAALLIVAVVLLAGSYTALAGGARVFFGVNVGPVFAPPPVYPAPVYGYPYPAYVYPTPPIVIERPAPVIVESPPAPPPPEPHYWYYCEDPQGYYPAEEAQEQERWKRDLGFPLVRLEIHF